MMLSDKGERYGLRKTLVMICALLLLAGCTGGLLEERAPAGGTPQPVLPRVEDARDTMSVMMFYRFLDEPRLALEPREITTRLDNRLLLAEEVVKAWLSGPTNVELRALVNASTTLLAISEEGDLVNVTLSSDFLKPLERMPLNWQAVPQLKAEAAVDHEQSLYALGATLLELGIWSKVQLLVAQNASLEGARVTWNDLGVVSKEDRFVEPVAWSDEMEDLVLTPVKALEIVLKAYNQRDVKTLRKYLAQVGKDGRQRPIESELENFLLRSVGIKDDFTIDASSAVITTNGQQACVITDLTLVLQNGAVKEMRSHPMLLYRENQLWKLDYASLEWLNELAQR